MSKSETRLTVCTAALCLIVGGTGLALAQTPLGSGFSFQGQLKQGGVPLNNTADLEFTLHDSVALGNQIGGVVAIDNVTVVDGLFTVEVNSGGEFGPDALNGEARFLEVAVRSPAGSGDFTPLDPRQPLTAMPYALQTRGIFVDDAGDVGIGTSTPIYPFHVESDGAFSIVGVTQSTFGTGVLGLASANSGVTEGGRFESSSTSGLGVVGLASANSGFTDGGRFESASTSGRGVYGVASASSGVTFGGVFESSSTSGLGVSGVATASSGQAYGGRFESRSTSGLGVRGLASANSGFTDGGRFESRSTSGRGVYGVASASSGVTFGGVFESSSTSGLGVSGIATASSGTTYGGQFESRSTSGGGVFGLAIATTGITYGGWFESRSTTGRAVFGFANSNSGVNFGVVGHSNSPDGFDFWASGAGTNYGSPSSRRWKSNVVPISDPLDKLAKLQGVYFDWDDEHGGLHDVGMIAEEVGGVMPEIVQYEENGIDAIGMDYSKLTPLLVEAMNALHGQVRHKDAQITELQARLAALEALVDRLTVDRNGGAE